jgi:predicted nucleic acid-binding protein
MTNPKRIYWDSCAWIAYIQQEVMVGKDGAIENRYEMCRNILRDAEHGKLEIATSAFTLAEVCKSPTIKTSPVDHLPSFFDKSYLLIIPVDKNIAQKAQSIQLAGIYGLKPADAIHVASAYAAKSLELHTFDADILSLHQKITGGDGLPMTICKPGAQQPAGPLLDLLSPS